MIIFGSYTVASCLNDLIISICFRNWVTRLDTANTWLFCLGILNLAIIFGSYTTASCLNDLTISICFRNCVALNTTESNGVGVDAKYWFVNPNDLVVIRCDINEIAYLYLGSDLDNPGRAVFTWLIVCISGIHFWKVQLVIVVDRLTTLVLVKVILVVVFDTIWTMTEIIVSLILI